MEKFQLYRTALDALQFVVSSDLGFNDEMMKSLKFAYLHVCKELIDLVKPKDE